MGLEFWWWSQVKCLESDIQKWERLRIFTFCCTFQTKDGKGDDGFTSITESDSEFKTMTSENSMFETAQSGAVSATV